MIELFESQKAPVFVIPAKAGIQGIQSRGGRLPLPDQVEDKLRGSDGLGDFLHGRHILILEKTISTPTLQKSRMLQVLGVEGEAVVLYCEPSTTQ